MNNLNFMEMILPVSAEPFEENEVFKNSLQNMEGVLFIIDHNKNGLIWVGEGFEKNTGYLDDEFYKIICKGSKKYCHPDDYYFFKEWNDYLMHPGTQDQSFSELVRIKHKNGNYIWVYLCNFIISRNQDGSAHRAGCVMINFEKFMGTPYFDYHFNKHEQRQNNIIQDLLSNREKEILTLICKGLSAAQMADKFDLSKRTIETHKKNIQKKLGMNSLAELIRFAITCGF
jgi:DNA-binding CsgD family transcriptional regulator